MAGAIFAPSEAGQAILRHAGTLDGLLDSYGVETPRQSPAWRHPAIRRPASRPAPASAVLVAGTGACRHWPGRRCRRIGIGDHCYARGPARPLCAGCQCDGVRRCRPRRRHDRGRPMTMSRNLVTLSVVLNVFLAGALAGGAVWIRSGKSGQGYSLEAAGGRLPEQDRTVFRKALRDVRARVPSGHPRRPASQARGSRPAATAGSRHDGAGGGAGAGAQCRRHRPHAAGAAHRRVRCGKFRRGARRAGGRADAPCRTPRGRHAKKIAVTTDGKCRRRRLTREGQDLPDHRVRTGFQSRRRLEYRHELFDKIRDNSRSCRDRNGCDGCGILGDAIGTACRASAGRACRLGLRTGLASQPLGTLRPQPCSGLPPLLLRAWPGLLRLASAPCLAPPVSPPLISGKSA